MARIEGIGDDIGILCVIPPEWHRSRSHTLPGNDVRVHSPRGVVGELEDTSTRILL